MKGAMNKVILGIVIVLAVGVVAWFFFSQKEVAAPTEESGMSQTNTENENITAGGGAGSASLADDMIDGVTVNYTDAGFEPKSVTIQRGQTVQFVNLSSRGMWVGSDSHPTHTNYPTKSEGDCLGSSFDTCSSLPVGESWSFTFDETGSWGYHNHTQAGHRGAIIVQ